MISEDAHGNWFKSLIITFDKCKDQSTMATDRPVSLTALWTAVERGREIEYADKLLEGLYFIVGALNLVLDPFSLKLGGDEGMKMSEENRRGKPISGFYGIRAKCVDDLIRYCVEENQITQIVDAGTISNFFSFTKKHLDWILWLGDSSCIQ